MCALPCELLACNWCKHWRWLLLTRLRFMLVSKCITEINLGSVNRASGPILIMQVMITSFMVPGSPGLYHHEAVTEQGQWWQSWRLTRPTFHVSKKVGTHCHTEPILQLYNITRAECVEKHVCKIGRGSRSILWKTLFFSSFLAPMKVRGQGQPLNCRVLIKYT